VETVETEDANFTFARALWRYRSGDFDGAVDDLSRSLATEPARAEAYAARAAARVESGGDVLRAIADYRRALELAAPWWTHRASVKRALLRLNAPAS
jgi:Tfp pilus assembly protein PilF